MKTEDRLTRIETRLAQLMTYVGANVQDPNKKGELIAKLATEIKKACPCQDCRCAGPVSESVEDWK